jgi:hypothetical protein
MKKEIWKAIPGYENYQVSNWGKIRTLNYNRTRTTKELKTSLYGGYLSIALQKEGKRQIFRLHVLVAMAFKEFQPDGHSFVIDHINEDKMDNRVENLQIVSQRQNLSRSKIRHDSLPTGVHNYKGTNRFVAKCRMGNKNHHLGYHATPEEASQAYQNFLKQNNIL